MSTAPTITKIRQRLAPAAYTHTPRPPERGGGKYDNQLRYGGHRVVRMGRGSTTQVEMEVYRDANAVKSTAQLNIDLFSDRVTDWHCSIEMHPTDLEALAFALLDAAADIRSPKGGAA